MLVGLDGVFWILRESQLQDYRSNALISFDANRSLDGTASPTLEKETFQRSLLAAQLANSKTNGKKAGEDAPPVNIGWDSHKPVVSMSW